MNTSKAKKNKPQEEKDEKYFLADQFTVERVRVIDGEKGDIVFFTLEVRGLYIYNCRVATGKNGDFISFPQTKGKDGKYYNVCYGKFIPEEEEAILAEVQRQIDEM